MRSACVWPPFRFRITTPRLELRGVTPELVDDIIELALGGIHDPAVMPFNVPWTDLPSPMLEREALRYYYGMFASCAPQDWSLAFAVFENGTLVGVQDVIAQQFPALRQFRTGSWLGRQFQGRGVGKEMRAAVLHFGFAGLDAARATTSAFSDNAASLGVTRALGYRENGTLWLLRRDEPAQQLLFVLDRPQWEESRRADITIEGLDADACAFLGI